MSCGHETKRGGACEADFGLCPKCGKCFNHCPHRETERKKAKSKGGKTGGGHNRKPSVTASEDEAPPPPESIEDAVTWASWATYAVATGKLDTKTAHEVGYLLNALQRALEKVDMADRVEELKEKLEALERRQNMRSPA